MSGASLIFSPSTPDWAHIRSIESSYQVSLIADNPSHLRHFIVESQVAQYQALAAANTRLAQANAGLLGIQSGLSDLTGAVQEGFEAVGAALDGISGQIGQIGRVPARQVCRRALSAASRWSDVRHGPASGPARRSGDAQATRSARGHAPSRTDGPGRAIIPSALRPPWCRESDPEMPSRRPEPGPSR